MRLRALVISALMAGAFTADKGIHFWTADVPFILGGTFASVAVGYGLGKLPLPRFLERWFDWALGKVTPMP